VWVGLPTTELLKLSGYHNRSCRLLVSWPTWACCHGGYPPTPEDGSGSPTGDQPCPKMPVRSAGLRHQSMGLCLGVVTVLTISGRPLRRSFFYFAPRGGCRTHVNTYVYTHIYVSIFIKVVENVMPLHPRAPAAPTATSWDPGA
jgi:hypothetical protein